MFFKRRKRSLPPEKDPHSLGNIAVREGHVTQAHLEELIVEFKSDCERRIGEFLVEKGVLTKVQLQELLLMQVRLRKAEAHVISMQALALAQASQNEQEENGEDFLVMMEKTKNGNES